MRRVSKKENELRKLGINPSSFDGWIDCVFLIVESLGEASLEKIAVIIGDALGARVEERTIKKSIEDYDTEEEMIRLKDGRYSLVTEEFSCVSREYLELLRHPERRTLGKRHERNGTQPYTVSRKLLNRISGVLKSSEYIESY
tara:strand:- start:3240 stop:3668 length:429 start_codon:yes stop_codon:yes gene_type:complete